MEIKNYMEKLVFSMLNDVIGDIDVCSCDKCMLDIAALALNKLPPKYVVTEKGELYSKTNILKRQFEVDILTAITKAAEKVNENPRHDDK
ncbi:MAG TPA: late competence development ComFB family protein [Clostridiaceae bacterium]|nr:late competence development ComFB family protein [Clostridiaceae bacterium]